MEQASYWAWSNLKHSLNSQVLSSTNPSYDDSWEEQAFAEDAAGNLGGCTWPPRSYTCSFCRREFRSAQALGGHMNVHRRERARLKQSPPSPQNEILNHQNIQYNKILKPCDSLDVQVQYPSQICNLIYNPNPNSDSDHGIFPSPSSSSRVIPAPTTKLTNGDEKTLLPPFSPSIDQENKKRPSISYPPLWSNLSADKYFHISDLKDGEKHLKTLESNSMAKGEYVTADLSVRLNLVFCQTQSNMSSAKEDEVMRCKRRRIELSPSSIEDLDLELRLG